jgi:hypothetical protein
MKIRPLLERKDRLIQPPEYRFNCIYLFFQHGAKVINYRVE